MQKRRRKNPDAADRRAAKKSSAEQRVEAVKASKYSLLMNPENLSEIYQAKLKQLLLHDKRLATAYRLKEELRLIFKLSSDEVSAALDKWRRRAWSCRIEQFVKLQRKIKRHKDAIIATITNGISNARIEATNNKISVTGIYSNFCYPIRFLFFR